MIKGGKKKEQSGINCRGKSGLPKKKKKSKKRWEKVHEHRREQQEEQ